MVRPTDRLIAEAADAFDRARARRPRVHCLTNSVAQAFTANALLAFGAVPSMTSSAEEVAGFVASADALLVNLGTLDAERRAAISVALDRAAAGGLPWVLDPVLIDRSPARARFAGEIAARGPAAVRMNRAEADALARLEARPVVVVSGGVDHVSHADRRALVTNGHPLMAKVTAMGCASGAIIAALLASRAEPFVAALGAVLAVGVAGEIAGEAARGPGSFAIAWLDALQAVDGVTIERRGRIAA
jgi:hydroxyethylthiazole kinase